MGLDYSVRKWIELRNQKFQEDSATCIKLSAKDWEGVEQEVRNRDGQDGKGKK